MSASVGVGGRATPVLGKEQGQPLLGALELLFGIHRSEELVLRDAQIEDVDDAGDRGETADLVVEGHFWVLPSSFGFLRRQIPRSGMIGTPVTAFGPTDTDAGRLEATTADG